MRERLNRALPALGGLTLFLIALEVLRRQLVATSLGEVMADLRAIPRGRILAALLLTALNYAALTGYDFLAFASIGRWLDRWRIVVASFLVYSIAYNVGFAMLSGAAVRFRFYARWGLSGEELSRIVVSYSITFWLGLLALGGVSLARGPVAETSQLGGAWLAALGWALVGVALSFVV